MLLLIIESFESGGENMSSILSLILRNLIKASLSVGIIYGFRFLYNMNKREVISVKKTSKKEYIGDYIILSTKLSLAMLSSYHFFMCIYSISSIISLNDPVILFETIALLLILSIFPFLFIYFLITDLRNNYV